MNFITKLRIGQDSLICYEYNAKNYYEYNAKNYEKTYRFIGTYFVSEPKLVKRSRPCTLNEGNLWLQSQDKIDWSEMSKYPSPSVDNLHEQIECKIDWSMLSSSHGPFIFEYDYEAIQTHFRLILQGIIQNRFHPKNIKYFAGWGYDDFEEFKE